MTLLHRRSLVVWGTNEGFQQGKDEWGMGGGDLREGTEDEGGSQGVPGDCGFFIRSWNREA